VGVLLTEKAAAAEEIGRWKVVSLKSRHTHFFPFDADELGASGGIDEAAEAGVASQGPTSPPQGCCGSQTTQTCQLVRMAKANEEETELFNEVFITPANGRQGEEKKASKKTKRVPVLLAIGSCNPNRGT
jgi:hypothetical protein